MLLGPLAHAALTVGAAADPGRWLVAGAVRDHQLHVRPVGAEGDVGGGSRSMPQDVGQRLLQHAEQRQLNVVRQVRLVAFDVMLTGSPAARALSSNAAMSVREAALAVASTRPLSKPILEFG